MMDNTIFSKDIEVPEIVTKKAEAAFAKISMEGIGTMSNEFEGKTKKIEERTNDNNRRKEYQKKIKLFRSQAAVIVGICIFVAGSTTAIAALHNLWSRGMKGTLQASEVQQEVLIDEGVANVITDSASYVDLAVTNDNVTVAPETVIVDDNFAYISFSVKGYSLGENEEPSFEHVLTELADATGDNFLNMNSSFYDGIVLDEKGNTAYADGKAIEFDESGNLITKYADEDGTLDYVIQAFVTNYDDSLLGKKVHVVFENIGTSSKAAHTNTITGKWEFTIPLPNVSSAKEITVGKAVAGSGFTLESINLSPVSVQLNYSINGEPVMKEDEIGVPDFCGVVLKDGTKWPFIANGGSAGYTDDSLTTVYVLSAFNRLLEPDQVAAILVSNPSGSDMIEIPLDK